MDSGFIDYVAQEVNRELMKCTFFSLKEEVEFSEFGEDGPYVLVVFGEAPGVNEDVINIHDHEAVEILPEHCMHEVLKDGRGVDEAIRHDPIFVVA